MRTPTKTSGTLQLTLVTLLVTLLGSLGCRAVTGIFKAGMWLGIVGLRLMVAVVLGIARLARR